jgi:hypothetical protein
MSINAPNVFRLRGATINLDHVLAISTGEFEGSPGVDITMRGDRQHFPYFETQGEANQLFERIVRCWAASTAGILVHRQIAFLHAAAFSIQPVGEHVVILFHHSEHRIRVGAGRNLEVYDGLVAAWEKCAQQQRETADS